MKYVMVRRELTTGVMEMVECGNAFSDMQKYVREVLKEDISVLNQIGFIHEGAEYQVIENRNYKKEKQVDYLRDAFLKEIDYIIDWNYENRIKLTDDEKEKVVDKFMDNVLINYIDEVIRESEEEDNVSIDDYDTHYYDEHEDDFKESWVD